MTATQADALRSVVMHLESGGPMAAVRQTLQSQAAEAQAVRQEQLRLENAAPVAVAAHDLASEPSVEDEAPEATISEDMLRAQRDLHEAGQKQLAMSGDLAQVRTEVAVAAASGARGAQAAATSPGTGAFSLVEQTLQDRFAQTQQEYTEYMTQKEIAHFSAAAAAEAAAAEAAAAEAAPSGAEGASGVEAVASGTEAAQAQVAEEPKPLARTAAPHKKRAPEAGKGEEGRRFRTVDACSREATDRVEEMFHVVGQWQHARRVGFEDFRKAGFIKNANAWSIACMKFLTRGDALQTTHAKLAQDIPGGFVSSDVKQSIKDMVECHDGELREISGMWETQAGPAPTAEDEPHLYHCQFACNRQDFLAWQGKGYPARRSSAPGPGEMLSSVLKTPASGGGPVFGAETHLTRRATVVGLGELLWFFGSEFTACELYAFFTHAQRLTLKRRAWWQQQRQRRQR